MKLTTVHFLPPTDIVATENGFLGHKCARFYPKRTGSDRRL